jgi:hypothetical protein
VIRHTSNSLLHYQAAASLTLKGIQIFSSGAVGTAGADWCTKVAAARRALLLLLLLLLFPCRWCLLRPAAAAACALLLREGHCCGMAHLLLLEQGNAWQPAAAAEGERTAEGSSAVLVDAAVDSGVLGCRSLLPRPRKLLRGATECAGCLVLLSCSREPAWWPENARILLLLFPCCSEHVQARDHCPSAVRGSRGLGGCKKSVHRA